MPLTSMPVAAGMSSGDGRKSTTASSIGWTPLFLKAEPHSTGTNENDSVPLRMARRMSSGESSSSDRYFSMRSSSSVATMSSILARHSSAWASNSAGIGTSS